MGAGGRGVWKRMLSKKSEQLLCCKLLLSRSSGCSLFFGGGFTFSGGGVMAYEIAGQVRGFAEMLARVVRSLEIEDREADSIARDGCSRGLVPST